MIELDFQPSNKKLKEFGIAGLFGFGLIGALIAYKTKAFEASGSLTIPLIFWVLAVLVFVLALTLPKLLKPLFILLMVITFPIGFIMGNIMMGLIYYGMFTPIALFFKLKGRDLLNRKRDPNASSHWISSRANRPAKDYYRQF